MIEQDNTEFKMSLSMRQREYYLCLLPLRAVKRFSTLNTGAFYYVCLMAYAVPWNSICLLHSRISYEDVRIALYFLFGMA
jgi:hypothetical protein